MMRTSNELSKFWRRVFAIGVAFADPSLVRGPSNPYPQAVVKKVMLILLHVAHTLDPNEYQNRQEE